MLTVRYFAAARAAAGVAEEHADATTLAELLGTLADARGDRLAKILDSASFLVDGLACHDRHSPLPPNCTIDVLPPFAGG